MKDIYLFGTSTTSSRVKSFIDYHHLFIIKAFVIDDDFLNDKWFENHPVISMSDFKNIPDYENLNIFICIAWNNLNSDRKTVFNNLSAANLNLVNLISPTAIVRGQITGRNVFVGDGVGLEVGSEIDDNVFIDHHVFVGTNTKIEKHAYLGAKSMIAGEVTIGTQSFIGISATVFDQVSIGDKSIISGGEVIKRNVKRCSVIKSTADAQHSTAYSEEEIIHKLVVKKNVR